MQQIRDKLNSMIQEGEASGDEIYSTVIGLYENDLLTQQGDDKAEQVLDCLSGWCHPICYIGQGNYGRSS